MMNGHVLRAAAVGAASVAALVAGAACESTDEKTAVAEHKEVATPPAPSAPAPTDPTEKPAMHCSSFIDKAGVTKLGFDASHYDEQGMTSYGSQALTCHIGHVTFQVYTDKRYAGGLKKTFATPQEGKTLAELGMEIIDGPKYGSDTLWIGMKGSTQVYFVSKNGKRSAMVVSTHRDELDKVVPVLANAIEQ